VQTEWEPDELIDTWTLTGTDWDLIANKAGATRLGFAAMLKFYEIEGRFPAYREEVPPAAVRYLGSLVKVDPALYARYPWTGRSIKYHKARIRKVYRLASPLARLLVPGTSERRAETASIQVITAPSTSHAAQIGSSPQLTTFSGEFPQAKASRNRAPPAIHAPAHAAARSQLVGRQPRSLMNPAISTGRGRASHAALARTAAICTAAGPALIPMIPVPIMSAEM
jgi:hypothetical protein